MHFDGLIGAQRAVQVIPPKEGSDMYYDLPKGRMIFSQLYFSHVYFMNRWWLVTVSPFLLHHQQSLIRYYFKNQLILKKTKMRWASVYGWISDVTTSGTILVIPRNCIEVLWDRYFFHPPQYQASPHSTRKASAIAPRILPAAVWIANVTASHSYLVSPETGSSNGFWRTMPDTLPCSSSVAKKQVRLKSSTTLHISCLESSSEQGIFPLWYSWGSMCCNLNLFTIAWGVLFIGFHCFCVSVGGWVTVINFLFLFCNGC